MGLLMNVLDLISLVLRYISIKSIVFWEVGKFHSDGLRRPKEKGNLTKN